MECDQCGYVPDPFARTCARCGRVFGTPSPAQGAVPAVPSLPTGIVGVEKVALSDGRICKLCPSCRCANALDAVNCGWCGLSFVARGGTGALQPNAVQAPVNYGALPSPDPAYAVGAPADRRRRALASWLLLGALVSLIALFAFISGQKPTGSGFTLVSAPNASVGGRGVAEAVSADQFSQRLLTASAATGGELEVSLAWNSLTDLDLLVRDPSGELIMALHRRSASGGVQDVDANPTPLNEEGERRYAMGQIPGAQNVLPIKGMIVDLQDQMGMPQGLPGMGISPNSDVHAPSLFTRTPVEHTYFEHAPSGAYTVYVSCFSWYGPGSDPLPYTIQVRSRGKILFQGTGTIGPANYVENGATPIQACQFVIR